MDIISVKDAAKELKITPARVGVLIRAGRLPAQRLGREWLIKPRDLDKVRVRRPGAPKKKVD